MAELDKFDINSLKDLDRYAHDQHSIANIAQWIDYYASDNIIEKLHFMFGLDWQKALEDIPKALRGGDDFKQYCNQIKLNDIYNIDDCQKIYDDPSGYEINQYPKPLSLSNVKKRIHQIV